MSTGELTLTKPVKLKSGTEVTKAWVGAGPIVLVEGTSGEGTPFRTRLDLQKGMFVDPMPDVSDLEEASAVATSVRHKTK